MMFHDPDSLHLWINVFFVLAGVSVAFAFAALTVGIRDVRRSTATSGGSLSPMAGRREDEVHSVTARHAA